jgi:hypothetical protein
MSKRRREARAREAGDSFSEHVCRTNEQYSWNNKGDDDIFYIDRGTVELKKQRTIVESTKQYNTISKTEKKLVERSVQKLGASKEKSLEQKDSSVIDLWGDDAGISVKSKNRKISSKGKSIVAVVNGLSYNPSLVDHQDLLAEVLTYI